MKLKAPLPEKANLPGDPETETLPTTKNLTPNDTPPRQLPKVDAKTASKRMREFLKRGLITRAVVSYTPSEIPDDAKYDVYNWGIVVEVTPFETWPIRVKWVDGKTSWTDGTDLTVIHRGMTNTEVKTMVERETSILH